MNETSHKTWQTVQIGDSASQEFHLSPDLVKSFALITGDQNPIHIDEEFAKRAVFRKPVVHGVFQLSLISGLLATKMPGQGSILLRQEVTYPKPLFVGEIVTVIVEVIDKIIDTKQIAVKTLCLNSKNENTLEGISYVLPARR